MLVEYTGPSDRPRGRGTLEAQSGICTLVLVVDALSTCPERGGSGACELHPGGVGVGSRGVSFAECVRQGEGEAWREGEAKEEGREKGGGGPRRRVIYTF